MNGPSVLAGLVVTISCDIHLNYQDITTFFKTEFIGGHAHNFPGPAFSAWDTQYYVHDVVLAGTIEMVSESRVATFCSHFLRINISSTIKYIERYLVQDTC